MTVIFLELSFEEAWRKEWKKGLSCVLISKTLNHYCYVLRMRLKVVGPVYCV